MQVSIVDTNKLRLKTSFRLDAEYYHPRALEYEEKLLNNFNGHSVKESGCTVVSGPFGSSLKSEAYLKTGVPFVRISDLRNFLISENNLIFISKDDNKRLSSSSLKIGDIVLSKVGNTIGVAAIVTANIGNCNISENNIGIRMPLKFDEAQKTFFVTYLNSVPGQNQILRAISGNAQPKLNVSDIEEILVPHATFEFVELIHSIVGKSFQCVGESFQLFSKAQYLLLAELGLTNWQPKHQLAFIKNYSDTEAAARIDAEYYQPKFEVIIEAIKAYKGGWNTLGDLVTVKKSVEVGSGEYLDEGILFVRVSNLSPFEITEEKYISEKLYAEIKQHQPKQGEILFSKDATPGIAHYLDAPPRRMIPSGGILRLKSKTNKTNNEYLTLVLNSILVKEQINRDVGGSVILHWRPDQVKETVIPILAEDKQTEIQKKVTESLSLRKQSKHLLECAKRAVEIAIEQNEQTAIDWLNDQIGA